MNSRGPLVQRPALQGTSAPLGKGWGCAHAVPFVSRASLLPRTRCLLPRQTAQRTVPCMNASGRGNLPCLTPHWTALPCRKQAPACCSCFALLLCACSALPLPCSCCLAVTAALQLPCAYCTFAPALRLPCTWSCLGLPCTCLAPESLPCLACLAPALPSLNLHLTCTCFAPALYTALHMPCTCLIALALPTALHLPCTFHVDCATAESARHACL
jgi:hypothetical protein